MTRGSGLRRAGRTAVTVLVSWLVGWLVLAYMGIVPAWGLAPVLLWIDKAVESVGSISATQSQSPTAAPQPALSQEARSFADLADQFAANGDYVLAAQHYVEALRRSEGNPGLFFSVSRSWRFAGNPLRAASYMLAYLEEARLPPDVRRQLLQEVASLSTVAGATARELFALATETAARLPLEERAAERRAVAAAIASSGDVEALEIIAARSPEGLPEGLGPAAIDAAKAGHWTLARRLLQIAGGAVAGAARGEAYDYCRQTFGPEPACARVVLHAGFGGLPPVTSSAHCRPETAIDMERRERNLAGLMMIGLAVEHYRLYQRSEARRLWDEGQRLVRASDLGALCRQPWYEGVYIPVKAGDTWVFMGQNGPLNLPEGEETTPVDATVARVNWRAVVDPADRLDAMVLPDIREQQLHAAIGRADMPSQMADIAGLEPAQRPLRLAEVGRDWFRAFAAIEETLRRFESEAK